MFNERFSNRNDLTSADRCLEVFESNNPLGELALPTWQTSPTISKVFIWLIGAVCLRLVCSSNRFVYTFDFFTPESGQFGAMLDLAFAFSSRKFLVETSLEVRAESVEQSV